MLPLRVYPFPFAISACLHSLLAPKPHLIPLFPSICQKPLYLHSTSSFHLRQTKCSISFPSVVMKWEGEDKEGVTRERYRGKERERRRRGVQSYWQLCPETTALFPHLQRVNRRLLLCAYTLPHSLSPSVSISQIPLASSLMTKCMCTRSQHAHMNRNSGRERSVIVGVHALSKWQHF